MENKKPILVFDLDDTLYSKKKVFLDTLKEIYPNTSFDESSYKVYQEKSDEAFELFSKGKISLEENHFSRVQNTLTALELPSSSQETMTFKKEYQFMMDHIQLDKEWVSFFDYLSPKANLVLLTNGPTDHQLKKIHSLNLYKWFTSERIFISESTGIKKPEHEAFINVEKLFPNTSPSKFWMIGDDLHNDIFGAKRRNWNTVYFKYEKTLQSLMSSPLSTPNQLLEKLLDECSFDL
ncbi:Putative HAD-hydrolase YfnB [Granulicatella adiacens]|uniref:HAD family hydrolase n=1 Tax=Granulicatella adiacens TaxID=46124 RepID=UPI001956FCC2|nr:HAD family hydrolase [Granulicatella adiacens]VTX58678.1 Putative HAD-hydrolase YfnB [Granulicatella adiacens]